MREYLFDVALILFGVAAALASWWLLTHLSDRRILRRMRPQAYFVQRAVDAWRDRCRPVFDARLCRDIASHYWRCLTSLGRCAAVWFWSRI